MRSRRPTRPVVELHIDRVVVHDHDLPARSREELAAGLVAGLGAVLGTHLSDVRLQPRPARVGELGLDEVVGFSSDEPVAAGRTIGQALAHGLGERLVPHGKVDPQAGLGREQARS
jgi:hypothetical protein